MTPDHLLDHFDRIADAPDAIPRLRRFILDLAVRGKLVEQNPNDEPAFELLKRIQAEKARLVKEGKIRSQKLQEKTVPKETGILLPKGWIWAPLGDVILLVSGQHLQPSEYSDQRTSGPPYITGPADFGQNGLLITRYAVVTKAVARKGQILLTVKGAGVGKTAICDLSEVAISRQLMAMTAIEWSQEFLLLTTHRLAEALKDSARSLIPGISREDVDEFIFPLPPLAEQHRIVAKVDELMALCDRLEAAQKERESRRDLLAAASLHRLNNGTIGKEFREHARFHLRHLPRLTTRPEHIQKLRQTILNLAVRGKLVPQDPNDEPASELLKQIERTRVHLYAERKIPKPKNLPPLESVEIPFEVGSGWEWTMLGMLCYQVSDGPHHSPKYVSSNTGVPFLSTRNVRIDRFDLNDLKYVSREDHERFCQRIRPEREDILYTKGGTTGIARVNDLDFEFSVWVHVAVLRIAKKFLVPRYVAMALNSPLCYEQSQAYTQGISNYDLGLTRMIKILMPLPPLAEQHRIVAKVDELMGLCAGLDAQLATTQTESRHLLDAVLYEALWK